MNKPRFGNPWARFSNSHTQEEKIMSKNKTNMTDFNTRFVTTKKGTYLIWYDVTFGRQRRVNLSKIGTKQYFGTSYQR